MLEIVQGAARDPDLVMSCDSATWRAMSSSLTPADALTTGRLKIEGNPAAVEHFARMFRVPTT